MGAREHYWILFGNYSNSDVLFSHNLAEGINMVSSIHIKLSVLFGLG